MPTTPVYLHHWTAHSDPGYSPYSRLLPHRPIQPVTDVILHILATPYHAFTHVLPLPPLVTFSCPHTRTFPHTPHTSYSHPSPPGFPDSPPHPFPAHCPFCQRPTRDATGGIPTPHARPVCRGHVTDYPWPRCGLPCLPHPDTTYPTLRSRAYPRFTAPAADSLPTPPSHKTPLRHPHGCPLVTHFPPLHSVATPEDTHTPPRFPRTPPPHRPIVSYPFTTPTPYATGASADRFTHAHHTLGLRLDTALPDQSLRSVTPHGCGHTVGCTLFPLPVPVCWLDVFDYLFSAVWTPRLLPPLYALYGLPCTYGLLHT